MARPAHYLFTFARSQGDHASFDEAVCKGMHPLDWVASRRAAGQSISLVSWQGITAAEYERFRHLAGQPARGQFEDYSKTSARESTLVSIDWLIRMTEVAGLDSAHHGRGHIFRVLLALRRLEDEPESRDEVMRDLARIRAEVQDK